MQYIENIPKIWNRTSFEGYHSGFITTKIKKTNYGYHITRFSNYVTILSIKFEVLQNGCAKATIKVDKNYHAPYQYTMYFDSDLNEVKSRKEWLSIQN